MYVRLTRGSGRRDAELTFNFASPDFGSRPSALLKYKQPQLAEFVSQEEKGATRYVLTFACLLPSLLLS